MKKPMLSVVLLNYNHGNFLRQSIDSVLSQTWREFELIIVDDGSTDGSWGIVEDISKRDSRIVAERFAQNRGLFAAAARGLELCQGDYLYWRAADDYLISSDFFSHFAEAMKLYPNVAGAFAGTEIVDGKSGRRCGILGYRKSAEEAGRMFTVISKEQARYEFRSLLLFVPGASAIWRRELIGCVGGLDSTLGPQSDYFINHVLPMQHGVVEIHELAAVMRGQIDNYSANVEEELFFTRHALVEKKIRLLIPEASDEPAWQHWRNCIIGHHFVTLGDTSPAPLLTLLDDMASIFRSLPRQSREILLTRLGEFRRAVILEYEQLSNNKELRKSQAHAIFEKIVYGS